MLYVNYHSEGQRRNDLPISKKLQLFRHFHKDSNPGSDFLTTAFGSPLFNSAALIDIKTCLTYYLLRCENKMNHGIYHVTPAVEALCLTQRGQLSHTLYYLPQNLPVNVTLFNVVALLQQSCGLELSASFIKVVRISDLCRKCL